MKLKTFHKQELSEFLNSEAYRQMPVIPISPHRGKSHVENPRAHINDVLMLIAYEGEEMIGYLGLLPDDLFMNDTINHCAWMSCIWVSKKSRGKGVARQMVKRAYELWDGKILATEFTDTALTIYRKLDLFDDFVTINGIRIYTRFAMAQVFPQKLRWTIILKPFFWIGDIVGNIVVSNWWKTEYKKIDFSNLMFSDLMESSAGSITSGFNRGHDEISWMLKYPWLQQQKSGDMMSRKYHFSSWAKQVKYIVVCEKNTDNKMLLFIRNHHLKIPYTLGQWPLHEIQNVLIWCIIHYEITTITTFHSKIVEVIGTFKSVFKRNQKRKYLIGKDFLKQITPTNDIDIQDGDGDCGFT